MSRSGARTRSGTGRVGGGAVAVALLAAACSGSSAGSAETPLAPPATSTTGAPPAEDRLVADDVPAIALADLEAFWTETLPSLGVAGLAPTVRLESSRPSDPSTLPACNGVVDAASFYADNAFYCRVERSIVVDTERFAPSIVAAHGPFALAVVVAHEYAHALQHQLGLSGTADGVELQADCLAGSWAADVGPDGLLAADAGAVDRALAALLDAGADASTVVGDRVAHGSTFERMSAFSEGFHEGPSACLAPGTSPGSLTGGRDAVTPPWDDGPPALVDAFGTYLADAGLLDGELPDVVALRTDDRTLDCDGRRPADAFAHRVTVCADRIVYDEFGLLGPLRSEHGRLAGSYPLLAGLAAWAFAGAEDGPVGGATVDCVIGAFVAGHGTPWADGAGIDEADLDALAAAMVVLDADRITGVERAPASLLSRVEAARLGVDEGLARCDRDHAP